MSNIINSYISYPDPPSDYVEATGGTETTTGDFKIHTFNSSSDFEVTGIGTAPNNVVEYLVIAAGGGGNANGGGGAGGYLEDNTGETVTKTTYTITIGGGGGVGSGTGANGANGGNSVYRDHTAIGGGGGFSGYSSSGGGRRRRQAIKYLY